MPICKNCKKEISKFDNDICPFCGQESPIDENYQTMDITRNISKANPSYQLYKSKCKKTFVILAFILGFLGVHYFYLGYITKGLKNLALGIIIFVSVALVLVYMLDLALLGLIISIIIELLIFNISQGVIFALKDSLKDARGEFLR